MRVSSSRISGLFFLGATACSAAPTSVAPLVVEASASSSTAAAGYPDPKVISVVLVGAPRHVVVDGDLGEWGVWPTPMPSLPIDDEREPASTGAAKKPPAPPPNPPDAASRLALSITSESVSIAADLGAQARDGVWIGIGAAPPEMPYLGEFVGRAGFLPLNCEQTMVVTSEDDGSQGYGWEPSPPETKAACEAVVARETAFESANRKRFAKVFKVDRDGVKSVSESGELASVVGAEAVLRPSAKGATLEISLPLSAMPRVAQAPLTTLRVVARPLSAKPPEPSMKQWIAAKLPEAVSFEPYGALRAFAFRSANELGDFYPGTTGFQEPRALSFQPGEPLRVEVMDAGDCTVVTPRQQTLYTKQATLGAIEVGYVTAAIRGYLGCGAASKDSVVIFENGKSDIVTLDGNPKGVIERNGELHVLSVTDWEKKWSVTSVAPDGTHHDIALTPREPTDKERQGAELADFVSPGLDSFGWRSAKNLQGIEVTWTWDAAAKSYVMKERHVAIAKKPSKPSSAPKRRD